MTNIPQTVDEYRQWWQEKRPDIPYGYCWCECGQVTSSARQRDRKQNYFRGEPMRYARGHGNAKPRISSSNYVITDTGYKTPCWLWNRVRFYETGYGMLYERGSGMPQLAHRVFYQHYKGNIPLGLSLDHLCRQPACVNPGHLEPVTIAVNRQRGDGIKLTSDKVKAIRQLRAAGVTYDQIAEEFEVVRETVRAACIGRTWKNV